MSGSTDGCCGTPTPIPSNEARCPVSGSRGCSVGLETVKALLTEQALARLEPGAYRFCPDAGCTTVYFNAAGTRFDTGDLRVPVWQKCPAGSRVLCYCFGESEASIRAEIEATGRSHAAERVRAHIAAGRCACELRNPRGACCLGDVMAAVARMHGARPAVDDRDDAADAVSRAAVARLRSAGSDDGR